MKLIDWMAKEKLTNVWLAHKLECTTESVSMWRREHGRPQALAIRAIERLTNYEVRELDFPTKKEVENQRNTTKKKPSGRPKAETF